MCLFLDPLLQLLSLFLKAESHYPLSPIILFLNFYFETHKNEKKQKDEGKKMKL